MSEGDGLGPDTRADLKVGARLWHDIHEQWGTVTSVADRPGLPDDEVEMLYDDGRRVVAKCKRLCWSD